MTVKELIHRLTADGISLSDEVIFKDMQSDKTFKISAVGYDTDARKVIVNNLYS